MILRYLPIMAAGGTLYPLTISFDSPPIPMLPLVVGGLRLQGSAGAPRAQIRKMLQFASEHQIKPMIMTFELNKEGVELGMKTLREGKMRYRGVLVAK
jgi:D-arabinose 1-dehydrogenase-like Zn-dependent alcohol dehydrogenase